MCNAISEETACASAVFAIFTKVPAYGVPVKTRLKDSCSLAASDIEALAEGFLIDSASAVTKTAKTSIAIISDPIIDIQTLKGIFTRHQAAFPDNPELLRFFAQEDSPFGDRLQAALELLAAEYQAPIVLVGTDTPTLSPAILTQAAQIVQAGHFAVGPSSAGGFYLLGIPQNGLALGFSLKTLFADPQASELERLCLTIKSIDGQYELLAPQFDIDTETDLVTLLDLMLALKDQSPQDPNACICAYPATSAKIIDRIGIRVSRDSKDNRLTKIGHS